MRPIKYRAFHKELKIMREVCTLRLDFNEVIVKFEKEGWTDKTTWFEGKFELMQFTGLHDRNKLEEIYEGDIIDENGNIKGNIHESSQIYQEGIDIIIERMGTSTWRNTESVAMGRGCKYAK